MRRDIGQRLKEARLQARLTQQDVATDFLVSRQAISSWESGRTSPSLLEFRELAVLYGASTDSILIGVQDAGEAQRQLLARVRRSAQAPRAEAGA